MRKEVKEEACGIWKNEYWWLSEEVEHYQKET